jgi:pimeloyl-ACP methyl ester carboxylesterase
MDLVKAENKYLDINDLRLHYLDWDNCGNRPMLLLHGFMGHAHVWDAFSLQFRNQYHVIALDQRGHGESQRSQKAAYSIDEHFSDLSRIAETLDLKDLVIIDHSMGGRNALFFTVCVPERVQRLILVDSRPGNSAESSSALMQLLLHFPLQANSLDQVVESIQKLHPYLPETTAYHLSEHGYTRSECGEYIPKFDTRMALQIEKAKYSPENIWRFLKNVSCPTLVVRGEESPFLSREDAKKMCSFLPKAELREIPHAAHMPVLENPDAFNRVVSDFLSKPLML